MNRLHDTYPNGSAWQTGELSDSYMALAYRRLEGVFYVDAAKKLGAGLQEVGSSRTVYNLPLNERPSTPVDAMVGAASSVAYQIDQGGIQRFGNNKLQLRTDEAPTEFEPDTTVIDRAMSAMSPESLIGYLRAERTETGTQISVGALDPTSQTHYSLPLPSF
jgi:hypothetical protein